MTKKGIEHYLATIGYTYVGSDVDISNGESFSILEDEEGQKHKLIFCEYEE